MNPTHPLNADTPIVLRVLGRFILFSSVSPENASFPMAFTLLGIDILVIELHLAKDLYSIVVNPDGSVIFVNPEQPSKALSLILVTLLGITTLVT